MPSEGIDEESLENSQTGFVAVVAFLSDGTTPQPVKMACQWNSLGILEY